MTAPPHLFGARPVRLLVAEVAVLVLVLAGLASREAALVAAVPCALVLLTALGRHRGRWLTDSMRVRADFRVRLAAAEGRRSTRSASSDARLRAFGPLLHRVALREAIDHGGARVGLVGDGTSWAVVLELSAPGHVDDEPAPDAAGSGELPLDALHAAVVEPGDVVAAVQLVATTVPGPDPSSASVEDVAASRYLELLGGRCVPAVRRTWVAVRSDPTACASAVAARGGGTTGAHRALLGSAARLAARLSATGLRVRALDAAGVAEALQAAGQLGAVGAPSESWSMWGCGRRLHASFTLSEWPPANRLVLDRLSGASGCADTWAVTLTRADGVPSRRRASAGGRAASPTDVPVSVSAIVRVTGRSSAELADATAGLAARARSTGLVLRRLDGEQGPAVLAGLPLAGVGA